MEVYVRWEDQQLKIDGCLLYDQRVNGFVHARSVWKSWDVIGKLWLTIIDKRLIDWVLNTIIDNVGNHQETADILGILYSYDSYGRSLVSKAMLL